MKVFSSFEFSFLSGTADLTTQPLPLLRPTKFPSFPSLSSLGNNISAVVSLTEARKFGELRFLFLSSKLFFFFFFGLFLDCLLSDAQHANSIHFFLTEPLRVYFVLGSHS